MLKPRERIAEMNRLFFSLLGLVASLITLLVADPGQAQGPDERSKPPLVIAIDPSYPPFTVAMPDGTATGIVAETWRLWSKANDWPIRFLKTDWADTLEAMREGRADIHSGLFITEGRAEYLSFTSPIHNVASGIYGRAGPDLPPDLNGLEGRRIAVIKATAQHDFLEAQDRPWTILPMANLEKTVLAVLRGEADVLVGEVPAIGGMLAKLGLQGALVRSGPFISETTLHGAVAKGNERLLARIEAGFDKVALEDLVAVERLWISKADERFYEKKLIGNALTPEEIAWIKANPLQKIAVTDFINPIDIVDNQGTYTGLNADLIALLNKQLGLQLVPDFSGEWSEVVEKITTGAVDAALSLSRTPEREKTVIFTDPYAFDPLVLVTRADTSAIDTWSDIGGLNRVSVLEGMAAADYVAGQLGEQAELVTYPDGGQALRALRRGEIDAHVSTLVLYGNLQRARPTGGLRIAATQSLEPGALRIGVHKSKPELATILAKGLKQLPLGELQGLREKWLSVTERALGGLDLTDQEAAWLEANDPVRIGMMPKWPPFHIVDSGGGRSGISEEIADLINDRLGGRAELVVGDWSQLQEDLATGRIDALMDFSPTPERQKLFSFTEPYLVVPHHIVQRDNGPSFAREADLAKATVALEKGFGNVTYLKSRYPEITIIETADTLAALNAVLDGHADAYVGNRAVATYLIAENVLLGLSIGPLVEGPKSVLAIGLGKESPPLASILQKSLDSITAQEKRNIIARYLNTSASDALVKDSKIELTAAERAFLEANPRIRVHNETDWPPFNFYSGNEPRGYSIGYMDLLAEKLGIEIEYRSGPTWNEFLTMMRDGSLDVMLNIVQTEDRDKYIEFTAPYMENPSVLVTRADEAEIRTFADLTGRTVALPEGFFFQEIIERKYPDINLLLVPDQGQALRSVAFGEADATLGGFAVQSYLINKFALTNLKVAGEAPRSDFLNQLRIGVRKDWPVLATILSKAIQAVTPAEERALQETWLGSRVGTDGSSVVLSPSEAAYIRDKKSILVAAESHSAPWSLYGSDGEPTGFAPELLELITERLGLDIEWAKLSTWNEIEADARIGQLDLVTGYLQATDSLPTMLASGPYGKALIGLYARQGNSDPLTEADLGLKRLAYVANSPVAKLLRDRSLDVNGISSDTPLEAVNLVRSGEADLYVGGQMATNHLLADYGISDMAFVQSLQIDTSATSARTDYTFAVRGDQPTLLSVINKAMNSLTPQEWEELETTWLRERTLPSSIQDDDTLDLTLIFGASIVGILLMLAGLFLLVGRLQKDRDFAGYFGSPSFRLGVMSGLSLLVTVVAILNWIAVKDSAERARESTSEDLQVVLHGAIERLLGFLELREGRLEDLKRNPDFLDLARAAVVAPMEERQAAIDTLSEQFEREAAFADTAIALLGFDGLPIAANDKFRSVSPPRLTPDQLTQALSGEHVVLPPGKPDSRPGDAMLFWFVVPVGESANRTLLVKGVDAARTLSEQLALGWIGQSGEIFAFNRYGQVLSESRFRADLARLGLAEPPGPGWSGITLQDPGIDLTRQEGSLESRPDWPPTRMLASALELMRTGENSHAMRRHHGETAGPGGHAGPTHEANMSGYRDYRGVPVVGTWDWIPELGIGIAAEMDLAEMREQHEIFMFNLLLISITSTVLAVGATLFTLLVGQRSHAALTRARDELEQRVEDRTAELDTALRDLNAVLNNIDYGILFMDSELRAVLTNNGFRKIWKVDVHIGDQPVTMEDLMYEVATTGVYGVEGQELDAYIATRLERVQAGPIPPVTLTLADNREVLYQCIELPGGGRMLTYLDITEIKAKERRLAEQEAQFTSALDNMTDGIYLINGQAEFVLFNDRYVELTELPPGAIRKGQPVEWAIRSHANRGDYGEGDRVLLVAKRLAALKGDKPTHSTLMIDGGRRILDVRMNPISGGGAVVVLSDITEQRRAENALGEAEERSRLILESISEGVFGVSLEGAITFINSRGAQSLGYSPDELIGQKAHDLIHHTKADGSHYPIHDCPMWKAFTYGSSAHVTGEVLWRKDGTSFDVEYSARPISRGEEIVGAVVSFRDITDFIQLNRNFVALLENTSDFIYFKDVESRFVAASQTVANIASLKSWTDLKGKTDFDLFPGELAEQFRAQDRLVIEGDEAVLEVEEEYETPEGKGWLDTKKYVLRDQMQEVVGICGMSRDITQRKEAEARLKDAYDVISDSIDYAARIQRSVLPKPAMLSALFEDHFVIWEPRDNVGGDIYWANLWGDGALVVLGDCTGHGVPGAFMTLISTGALERAQIEAPKGDLSELVQRMHQFIQMTLGQHGAEGESDDGLELGACFIGPNMNMLSFVGARFSLFIVKDGEVEEIKGTRKGLGYRRTPLNQYFDINHVRIEEGMRFYMTSDGLIDQVGEQTGRSFGKKRFRELLISTANLPFEEQKTVILDSLITFQGRQSRRDDVSLIGFSV